MNFLAHNLGTSVTKEDKSCHVAIVIQGHLHTTRSLANHFISHNPTFSLRFESKVTKDDFIFNNHQWKLQQEYLNQLTFNYLSSSHITGGWEAFHEYQKKISMEVGKSLNPPGCVFKLSQKVSYVGLRACLSFHLMR